MRTRIVAAELSCSDRLLLIFFKAIAFRLVGHNR